VILRIAAALALLLGLVALLLFLQLVGEVPWSPPELRHLRAMKERAALPPALTAMTVADFAALPHDRPLAEVAPLERRGAALEGYVQRMVTATDGDIHFELVAPPRVPDAPDTAYVTAELTPRWRAGRPGWTFESLVAALHPNDAGPTPWPSGPLRARLSGWLLYDFQYDQRYGGHDARVSGWEIHPITRIEVWDDPAGHFVDVPR
jgi:hypothetical protein